MGLWKKFHLSVFFGACKHGDIRKIDEMLKSEPNLADIKDKKGVSGLHYAVANNHVDAVKLISEYCEHIDMTEEEKGYTPLLLAATNGNSEITEILLNEGADPNAQNIGGITPLHNAVYENELDVVNILVKYGADPFVKDRAGNTPLDLAERSRNRETLEILNKAKAGADRKTKTGLIKELVKERIDKVQPTKMLGMTTSDIDDLPMEVI